MSCIIIIIIMDFKLFVLSLFCIYSFSTLGQTYYSRNGAPGITAGGATWSNNTTWSTTSHTGGPAIGLGATIGAGVTVIIAQNHRVIRTGSITVSGGTCSGNPAPNTQNGGGHIEINGTLISDDQLIVNRGKVFVSATGEATFETGVGDLAMNLDCGDIENHGVFNYDGKVKIDGSCTNNPWTYPAGAATAPATINVIAAGPSITNSSTGTFNIEDELDTGSNPHCGQVYNSGQMNAKKVHNDAYFCNNGTLKLGAFQPSPYGPQAGEGEFKNHGGIVDCCGNIHTDGTIKFDPLGGEPGMSFCQNYCAGSAFNLDGSVKSPVPHVSTDIGAPPITPIGYTDGSGIVIVGLQSSDGYVGAGTVWCSQTALPVELVSFDVHIIEKSNVEISWSTISERNNDYFTVLRSFDGVSWIEIERVKGSGNSTERIDYSIIDTPTEVGLLYYRLKQNDFDGKSKVFEIKSVTIDVMDVVLFPNPANNFVELYSNENIGEVQVFNLAGELVNRMITITPVNEKRARLNIERLNSGVYILRIKDKVQKFVKK